MSPEERFQQNTGLVIYTLKKIFKDMKYIDLFSQKRGIEKDDLIQVGMLGLWKACLNYDENRNCEFSTYGISFIKGYILTEIGRNFSIKFPKEMKTKEKEDNSNIVSLQQKIYNDSEEDFEFSIKDNINIEKQVIDSVYLEQLLCDLKERDKLIFRMRLEKIPYKVISEKINMNKRGVEKAFNRAKKKIANKIIENDIVG